MFPPLQGVKLDLDALSGICGSISIACWIVVFSPQIIENFRRGSTEGLSIVFIVVWLAGDVFNILGAVLQDVLPTMIILAVYYTLADIVLLGQCFYYRGFTLSDHPSKPPLDTAGNGPTERSALLNGHSDERRFSNSSFHRLPRRSSTNLPKPSMLNLHPKTKLQTTLLNALAVLLVSATGVFGWWISIRSGSHKSTEERRRDQQSTLQLDLWGQIFGYLCAALYLGSRLPQLLLNYRRKSTEGVSMLFFIFACMGNLTYILSIFAFSPICEVPGHCRRGELTAIYGRYILVNTSWVIGSLGTLLLDLAIFVQFFVYRDKDDDVAVIG